MTQATRGLRAGRIAWAGAAVVGGVAAWGVPIDPGRVTTLVESTRVVHVRAEAAWIALRPLPTVVAAGVRVRVADRVDTELDSVAIRVGLGGADGRTPTWRSARVRGGGAVIRREQGAPPVHCSALRGQVTQARPTAVRLDLGGACRTPRIRLPAFRYRGDVTWNGRGGPRSLGVLTAERPSLGALRGTGMTAAVRTAGDGVRLDDVHLEIGEGLVTGRARWLRSGDARRVALRFEGAGDEAAVAVARAPHRVTGAWRVRGRGRAIGASRDALAHGLVGGGRVVLSNGSVEPLDVGTAVLDGLEVWRGRRRRRLRRRFPDVFGGEALRFDRAVARVAVRQGRWDVAPIRVRSRSYRADGHGRLARDGSVHGEIRLVPTAPLADALLGRGALRAVVAGGREDVVLPVEVRGRIGSLRVRPAPAFARAVLERALGGSALGRVLDRLLDR